MRYTLSGNDAELAKHKGHRVAITGTLMPAAGGSPTTPPSSDDRSGSGMAGQRLQVTSVKMVSATCP
jgi:hypothetical protein